MTKPAKIFILAVALLLGSLSILVVATSRPKTVAVKENQAKTKIDLVKLESEYKNRTKEIIDGFLKLLEPEQAPTIEQVVSAKETLLALRVPTQFKDLHLALVLAMDKTLNFISGKDAKGKVASQEIIRQAKNSYDWLN